MRNKLISIKFIIFMLFSLVVSVSVYAETVDNKNSFKCNLGEWKETSSLIEPVTGHYSFSVLDKVIIFHGQGLGISSAFYYTSEVSEKGLSYWKKSKPLRYVLEDFSAIMKDGFLYIAGGKNMGMTKGSVVTFPIKYDASLGFAKQGPRLPDPVIKAGITINKGHIFVTGGKKGMSVSNKTFSAPIEAEGKVGEWKEVTPLPIALYDHAMFSYKDFIYVSGGYHNGGSVYGAKVKEDGTIDKWIGMDDLPVSLERHAVIVKDDYVIVSGGLSNNRTHDGIYAGKFLENGILIQWKKIGTLPNPVFNHSMVINGGYLILSGGLSNGRSQSKVYIAPIN